MNDTNRPVAFSAVAESAGDRGRLAGYAHALVTAIQFMTRIRLSTSVATPESLRRAPLFFPLVGLGIGCFTAGVLLLGGWVWPGWIAVILALAAELRLTGALHEDGLADFCDGFGGGWDREQVLKILKDSRIGTYGVLGLGFAVALRVGSLIALIAEYGHDRWLYWGTALVASAAAGRWMIVLAMVWIPPIAERESLSRDVGSRMSWRDFALSGLGAIPAIVPFAYLMPMAALLAIGLNGLGLLVIASLIRRKLGGITGDCLGCIGYVGQILWLLSATAKFP